MKHTFILTSPFMNGEDKKNEEKHVDGFFGMDNLPQNTEMHLYFTNGFEISLPKNYVEFVCSCGSGSATQISCKYDDIRKTVSKLLSAFEDEEKGKNA